MDKKPANGDTRSVMKEMSFLLASTPADGGSPVFEMFYCPGELAEWKMVLEEMGFSCSVSEHPCETHDHGPVLGGKK
jgi:hypothetical protein